MDDEEIYVIVTKPKLLTLSIKWIVRGYNFMSNRFGARYESPLHTHTSVPDVTWRLILYPSGESETLKNYVGFYIEALLKRKEIWTAVDMFLVDDKLEPNLVNKMEPLLLKPASPGLGWEKLIKKSDLTSKTKNFIPNNILTILCKITMKIESFETSQPLRLENVDISINENFAKMFTREKYCDFTLISADGREFHVHRALLAATSDVFDVMFTGRLKENTTNTMNVENTDGDTLNNFLSFIYTGDFQDAPTVDGYIDLFGLAHQYALKLLKLRCENYLLSHISEDNVKTILEVATLYDAHKLKLAAEMFKA